MQVKRLFDDRGQVRGLRVIRRKQRQRFTPRFLHRGLTEGWLTLKGDAIILHGDRTVTYHILREPGRYPEPDAESGYEVTHFYECERRN